MVAIKPTTLPIGPIAVRTLPFIDTVPEDVYSVIIASFNDLIKKNYDNPHKSSEVMIKDVVELVKRSMPTREEWNMNWFNVETVYRDQGWTVIYQRPAWNESFEPYFVFRTY